MFRPIYLLGYAGGTAGLVLANRLSESGTQKILVLEAGPRPEVVSAYTTPGGNQFLSGTAIDWGFYTVPQANLNNRILPYHRGRALGGSSTTNGSPSQSLNSAQVILTTTLGLYYGRGSASVYDQWAALGNPGWGWDDLYPFSVKHTHFNPPNPNNGFDHTYETWDPSAYSDGPLEIGFQGYVPDSNIGFIQALEAANVPIVNELNTGNNTGVKQGTGCLDSRFRRSSSYDSFYRQAANRTNLNVLHYAPIQSIVTSQKNGSIVATGVVFIDEPTGLEHTVTACKEVILSMGAFHSPQLLMLSGIGPSSQLDSLGIKPVLINENVGQHMNDHSVFSIYATVTPDASTSSMSANSSSLEAAQAAFYSSLQGPYTAPSGITNGFQQLSNAELSSIGAQEIIDQGLTNRSHIEYLYESIFYPSGPTFATQTPASASNPYYVPQTNLSYISLTASSLVALSRGNLTLRSASPSDAPNINPNYYASQTDRAIAIAAFKYLRKILAHPSLSKFTMGPNNGEVAPGLDHVPADADDETIFQYVIANTIPNWHASGTNQMRPKEDGGVVDARLKVYGMEGLRVVDCSVIPELPDVNIQGPVFMVAEKGASLIREDWGF
ncbi:MAG: hypothetical protein Q9227_008464 [Pyrenula ochraceoflavens]